MNSYDILQIIAVFAGFIGCFYWGYEQGHQDGKLEGRKAVRKFYEQVGK
jgi:hypothetical protein